MSPIHLIFWLLCTGDVYGGICFLIQQTRRNIEKWCFLLIALDLPFSLCNSDSHLISHMLIDCGKSLLNRHPNLHDFFCKTFKYLIRSYTPSAWPSQFCQKKHFNFAEKYNREWTANSFNNQYLGKKKQIESGFELFLCIFFHWGCPVTREQYGHTFEEIKVIFISKH